MALPVSVVAVGGLLHRWKLGFRQFSFHRIARVLRSGALHAFRHPPLHRHAIVPLGFRFGVSRLTQERSFELFPVVQGIQRRISRRTLCQSVASSPSLR